MNESENDVRSQDLLGEHSFIIIYALHTLQESLVAPILPCVELKLKSSNARERKRAFRLLTRIFSEPSSTIHHKNPELFATFLSRFNDIDAEVRSFSIQMVPMMLKQNPELPRTKLIDCLKACTIDRVECKLESHLMQFTFFKDSLSFSTLLAAPIIRIIIFLF